MEGGLFHEQQADAGKHRRDYGQTAIVGTVTVSAPRPNVAWERFTHEGPLALLPLGGPRRPSTRSSGAARPKRRRAALPDDAFLRELGRAFGERMGDFVAIAGRASFPLGRRADARQRPRRDRRQCRANPAPRRGPGANLGLRDAHTLVDTLSAQGFEATALATFNARRALDRRFTIGATDTLARLFTIDSPAPLLRGAALTALEFVPPLKKVIARQMMFGQRN